MSHISRYPLRPLAVVLGVALLTATTAHAAPPKAGFERSPLAGLAKAKKTGSPKVIRQATAPEGSKVLRLTRSRKAQWVQHRYRPAANRLAVSFSYKRISTGRQIIFSLPANNIQLADTGTGKLLLMRPKKPARVIARVNRAGNWNRLKVIVDARRNRMRVVPNDRTRTRWQKANFRKEAGARFGAPSLKNGPVFYDAVNLSPRAEKKPPPAAADPAPTPIGTPPIVTTPPPVVTPPPPGVSPPPPPPPPGPTATTTVVGFQGSAWTINGRLTYPGTAAEGTLLSVRTANAIFDDANPVTRPYWKYADTGVWDPERNTNEFVAELPTYRSYGINAINISLMGGRPYTPGSAFNQDFPSTDVGVLPNDSIAFDKTTGEILPAWKSRAARVIEAADELGIVVYLTVSYWGVQQQIADDVEDQAVFHTARWIRDQGYTNVLLELQNEGGGFFTHERLPFARNGHPDLLVGSAMSPTSGRFSYQPQWWEQADYTCLHGNTRSDAEVFADIAMARTLTSGPLCLNEDDAGNITQSRFDQLNALGVGNGYYHQGNLQSLPIDWRISSHFSLRTYLEKVKAVTGGTTP